MKKEYLIKIGLSLSILLLLSIFSSSMSSTQQDCGISVVGTGFGFNLIIVTVKNNDVDKEITLCITWKCACGMEGCPEPQGADCKTFHIKKGEQKSIRFFVQHIPPCGEECPGPLDVATDISCPTEETPPPETETPAPTPTPTPPPETETPTPTPPTETESPTPTPTPTPPPETESPTPTPTPPTEEESPTPTSPPPEITPPTTPAQQIEIPSWGLPAIVVILILIALTGLVYFGLGRPGAGVPPVTKPPREIKEEAVKAIKILEKKPIDIKKHAVEELKKLKEKELSKTTEKGIDGAIRDINESIARLEYEDWKKTELPKLERRLEELKRKKPVNKSDIKKVEKEIKEAKESFKSSELKDLEKRVDEGETKLKSKRNTARRRDKTIHRKPITYVFDEEKKAVIEIKKQIKVLERAKEEKRKKDVIKELKKILLKIVYAEERVVEDEAKELEKSLEKNFKRLKYIRDNMINDCLWGTFIEVGENISFLGLHKGVHEAAKKRAKDPENPDISDYTRALGNELGKLGGRYSNEELKKFKDKFKECIEKVLENYRKLTEVKKEFKRILDGERERDKKSFKKFVSEGDEAYFKEKEEERYCNEEKALRMYKKAKEEIVRIEKDLSAFEKLIDEYVELWFDRMEAMNDIKREIQRRPRKPEDSAYINKLKKGLAEKKKSIDDHMKKVDPFKKGLTKEYKEVKK